MEFSNTVQVVATTAGYESGAGVGKLASNTYMLPLQHVRRLSARADNRDQDSQRSNGVTGQGPKYSIEVRGFSQGI